MTAVLAVAGKEVLGQWSASSAYDLWGDIEPEAEEAFKELQDQALQILANARGGNVDADWDSAALAFQHLLAAHVGQFGEDEPVPVLRATRELWDQVNATFAEADVLQELSGFLETARLLKVAHAAFEGASSLRMLTATLSIHGRVHWSVADLQRPFPDSRLEWLREATDAFGRAVDTAREAEAEAEAKAEVLARVRGVEPEFIKAELNTFRVQATLAQGVAQLNLALLTETQEDFEVAAETLESLIPDCETAEQTAHANTQLGLAAHHAGVQGNLPEWIGVQTVAFRGAATAHRELKDVANEALCYEWEAMGAGMLALQAKEVSRWRQAHESFRRAGLLFESIGSEDGVERTRTNLAKLIERWKAAGAPGALDLSSESGVNKEVTETGEGTGTIGEKPVAATDIPVGEDFAGAVGALKSQLVPTVTDEHIAQLEAVIREAQETPPADREGFVRDINRLLEAGGLRLAMEDGRLARLKHGYGGSIQFGVPGASRGFRKASFRVVRVTDSGRKSALGATTEQPEHVPE